MKIIYLGGQTAGVIGLLTLLADGHRPDVVAYSDDVYYLAESFSLWTLAYESALRLAKHYELLVSVHARHIVPASTLSQVKHGGINLHPCLTAYPGKNPIGRALADGCTKFSVGAHRMTAEVDKGEVLCEEWIEVSCADELQYTEAEIYARLYPLYSSVLSKAVKIVRGEK